MNIYKQYASMEYIDEYKNYENGRYSSYREEELSYNLDNSIFYNYAQFINLSIILLIVILYPIIIKITSPKDESYNEIKKEDYNYKAQCMENKSGITPQYDSDNLCPTASGNYGAPQPGFNNQSYHGETPYYQ